MIPLTLWQTYKTPYPPQTSLESIKSWLTKNPKLEWYYMDDVKCDRLIKDNFNDEFYSMYTSLPFGVMKADVWRVAAVYVYGGIYSDLDTLCLQSIDNWLKPEYDLIVGVETPHGAINNFTFAARAKHPALLTVLNLFLEIYNSTSFLNKTSPTPIQDFGAGGWSDGIIRHFGLKNIMHLGADGYNNSPTTLQEKAYFYSYESKAFSPCPDDHSFVYHQSGSIFWGGTSYDSWRKQQQEVFGVFGR